ncbi:MAG: AMP-binding protein [Spirochaetales bacterium]
MKTWRLLYNPDGDAGDIVSFGAALAEGRIVGKYQLSNEALSDAVVIQTVKRKSIVAGADISIDRKRAEKENIDVAFAPRQGRRGAKPVGSIFLSELMANSSPKFEAVQRDPEEPAALIYTSGTTGKPKGVVLSHKNFLSQCRDVNEHIFPLYSTDRIVLVLPLYHIYGLANGLIAGAYFGCAMSLVPQYSPQKLLDNICDVQATCLIAVPIMYTHLVTLARRKKAEIPKSLRISVSGGAPLPLETLKEFERVFDTRILEGYGLTESTSAVSLNESGDNFRPGSIGPAAPGVKMAIFDENNQEVPDGTEGEIVIRGDVITRGYWNLPDETAETVIDGWLHTGDLGYRDGDGYFFITDRKKDLIIRGGYNISPREVEEVLYAHPAIDEAAVIGVPDKRGEQVVKGFVVLKEGESASEKDVLEYCSAHLTGYKVPRSVEIVDSLPKSATGKVLRKELRGESSESDRMIIQEV